MDEIKVSLSKEKALNTEIKDINYIPGYKQYELERQQNEIIRQSNETTRQSNETARETYVNELKQRVDSGEFKGEKGDKGEDGKQGPAGPQGPQGETGPTGPQGEQGPKGEQGETGSQGPQGETGAKGEKGDKGDKGDKGEKGDNAIPPKSQNTATGTSIKLEDSSDLDIKSLVLSGKSTQATRSGKNLFDASKIPSSTGIVVTENGKTITMPLVTSGNGYTSTANTLSQLCPSLKVGDEVYLYFDRNLGLTNNSMIYIETAQVFWYIGAKKTITQAMLDGKVAFYGNRYINGETEQVVITDFRIAKNSTDTWEPYGVMPSPNYPSPIESVGRKNLFDVNSITENAYLIGGSGETGSSSVSNVSDYIFVKANQSYYLSYSYASLLNTAYRALCYYDTNKNFTNGMSIDPTSFHTFTPSQDGYIRFSYDKNYTNIQLEKGSVTTDYVQYEHTEISTEVTGKNLVNPTLQTYTQNGVTFTKNKDGTYTLNGTSTAASDNHIRGVKDKINVYKNNFYKLSSKVFSGTKSGSGIAEANARLVIGDTKTWAWLNGGGGKAKQPTDDGYIDIVNYYIAQGITFDNYRIGIQLEIVDSAASVETDWEQYKSNSPTIDLQGNELCSLPNGVKDEASIENGRAKIIKKVGKLTAEELEIGELILSDPNYILFSTTQLDGIAVSSEEKNSYCNVFQWAESLSSSALTDNNYAIETVESVDKTLLKVSLSKSLLSDYTRNSIKAWLTSNNFVLYYELVTPYEIALGEVKMPRTYYKVSNISNSANTDMSIEYYTEFKGEKGNKGEKGDDGGVMILAEDDDATKIQKALSCLNSNQTQLVRPLFYRTDDTHSVYPCVQYSESTSGNTFSFMLLMEDELSAMLMTIKNDAITENFVTVSLSSMIFPTITGYDATKTQVLKNVNGTLTWVDES